MKKLAAFVVLTAIAQVSFAETYSPPATISTTPDKTIHVVVVNDSGRDLDCHYKVSWFVNTFNYEKKFGELSLAKDQTVEFAFSNDEFSYLTHIKANVTCE